MTPPVLWARVCPISILIKIEGTKLNRNTAFRLPGDIHSPSNLWDFLVEKKSAQGSVPPERYNIGGFYAAQGNRSGTTNVPGGYFLDEDVRNFDNSFFGINNLEATYMDPQQRKLLEIVYECLVSSGTSMEVVAGSTTGVYVANFSVDYQPIQTRDPDYLHRYIATGSGATIMSNRISHVFNLHGPRFVDTNPSLLSDVGIILAKLTFNFS